MTILENLWYGNLAPNERTIKEGSKYHKLSKESILLEDQFINELSADGRKAYEAHFAKQMEMCGIEECESFICGFRLGAKMLLEVLSEYKSQLPQI